GCSLTEYAGGVLQAASVNAALAAATAAILRHRFVLIIVSLLQESFAKVRSIGDGIEQVHRGKKARRTSKFAQPLREDLLDLATHVHLRQRTVHLEPESRIVARNGEAVRLEREVFR